IKVYYFLIDVYSTQNFWYAFIISQICRLLNLKYFSKLHGGNLPNRINKSMFCSKLIFNNSYKNIAPSAYLFDVFKEAKFKNLVYIPNTINIDNYPFKERNIVVPKLLWVRSFSAIYNPIMAIDVLKLLRNDFPSAELCMVGPDKENMIPICELYAKEHNVEVKFTGKLEKEEWVELSKDYNIFINTTNFDNTPVSVIEAMSLGLPVVSTKVGGIPFLLKNNVDAILVEINDFEAMALAVRGLLLNPNFKNEIVINARVKVEKFDWNYVKNEWFQILK
ncbi:MAG: glycosyltransferase family 4 protein, partial [Flavobacterium sp.]